MQKKLNIISLILIGILVAWIFTRASTWFFAALYALLIACIGLLIYLIIAWHRLNKIDRWSLGLSILAWLFVFYGIIHANGLTISSWWG